MLIWPWHAQAASFAEDIVAQLTQQGFRDIAQETTWLGRVRIVATRSDGVREIILNPLTGEILRDLWTTPQGNTAYALVDPVGSKAGSAPPSTEISGNSGGAEGGAKGSSGSSEAEHPSEDPPEPKEVEKP